MKPKLSLAFIVPFLISLAIAGVAHAQVTVPNYWVINTSSSTIAPRIAGLQVPCADVSGGCVSGGGATTSINGVTGNITMSIVPTSSASSVTTSSAQIFLNLLNYTSSSDITVSTTGTIVFANHNISQFTNDAGYTSTTLPQGLAATSSPVFAAETITNNVSSTSFTANSTSTPSYIENNNLKFNVPTPSQLNGQDVFLWMKGVYDAMSSTVSSTEFDVPATAGTYTWGSQNNFNTNDERFTINCVAGGGSKFVYTGTSTAITVNTGDDHYWGSGINNCTFIGPSDAGTTTLVLWGGTHGAEGFSMTGNTVRNFGTPFIVASNTWQEKIENNIFTNNNNEGVFNAASNSGEEPTVSGNVFTEPFSTSTNCTFFGQNSLAGASITGNSWDDCWPYFGPGAAGANLSGNHFENVNYTAYNAGNPSAPFLVIATSSFTTVTGVGNFFINDETSSTINVPSAFVSNGGQYTSVGDTENSFGTTTPKFVSDVGGGFGSSVIINNHNVSSSVTNVINTDTAANNCQLIMTVTKSFSSDICATATNLLEFITGGAIHAVFNQNGTLNVGGATQATTTLYVSGSQGGLSNVTNVSATITTATGKNLFFTGPTSASATLPLWNASQGADFVITNDSTSSAYQVQTATSTESIFDCATGATSTFVLLPKGTTSSSIEVVNDGITTGIFRTICSAH